RANLWVLALAQTFQQRAATQSPESAKKPSWQGKLRLRTKQMLCRRTGQLVVSESHGVSARSPTGGNRRQGGDGPWSKESCSTSTASSSTRNRCGRRFGARWSRSAADTGDPTHRAGSWG